MKSHITTYYDPFDRMPHMKDKPQWWKGKLYQLDDKDYEQLEFFRQEYRKELEPLQNLLDKLEEGYELRVFNLIKDKEIK